MNLTQLTDRMDRIMDYLFKKILRDKKDALFPRIVLDQIGKVQKVAETAGIGEWHRTGDPVVEMQLPVTHAEYMLIREGQKEQPTTNPLLEAYADALVGFMNIAVVLDIEPEDLLKGAPEPEDEGDLTQSLLGVMNMLMVSHSEAESRTSGLVYAFSDFQRLNKMHLHLDPSQIDAAVTESIDRQRQTAGV